MNHVRLQPVCGTNVTVQMAQARLGLVNKLPDICAEKYNHLGQ
jgi:hypothetical protein